MSLGKLPVICTLVSLFTRIVKIILKDIHEDKIKLLCAVLGIMPGTHKVNTDYFYYYPVRRGWKKDFR